MAQVTPVPIADKQEEKPVVSVVKKQLVKLNFNPKAHAEDMLKLAENKAKLARKRARKAASRENQKEETKIGWFKYYKAAELILTDENGKKQTVVQHKWAKIPTPTKAKDSKSPQDSP